MEKHTEFVEFHQPCPECSSSDACSINEDGSAKCFSCGEFFPNYYKSIGEEMPMGAKVTNIKQLSEVLFLNCLCRVHDNKNIQFEMQDMLKI